MVKQLLTIATVITLGVLIPMPTFGDKEVASEIQQTTETNQTTHQTVTTGSHTIAGTNEAVGTGNVTKTTIVYPDYPAAGAAPTFSGLCSRGASGQGIGLGGSIAFTNEICDLEKAGEMLLTAAQVAKQHGNEKEYQEKMEDYYDTVDRASKLARARANKLRIILQYIPIIGQFM